MVKVTSWLFTEVRGKVKKAEFRRRKNKVTELSQKRIPFNPRTEAQQEVRKAYGKCVEEWNKLSEAEKREWRIIGTLQGISGYNAFMRECMNERLAKIWYEITIDNSANSNDLTDYQVLLEIVNDSTFFEDCQNEQKYLEFYDTDKATLLNHFVEEFDTTNKNAKIWIKVPYIPANASKTIYLKMNTKRTTDLSNPHNVFLLFEDFEDKTVGETPEGWDVVEDNCEIRVTDADAYRGSKCLRILDKGSQSGEVYAKKSFEPQTMLALDIAAKIQASAYSIFGLANADTPGYQKAPEAALSLGSGNTTLYYYSNGSAVSIESDDLNWHYYTIIVDTSNYIKILKDGVVKVENKPLNASVADFRQVLLKCLEGSFSTSYDYYYDYIKVRKYTEPPPSVSYKRL